MAAQIAPYQERPFLKPELREGQVADGFQHGGFDAMCAGDPPPALAAWAEWIRYNLPGPLGSSSLDRLPTRDGVPVPVMISAGTDDDVVHCVVPKGAEGTIPTARDCMPVALFDTLEGAYRADGEPRGHLALNVWQPQAGVTSADHSDIRGLNAAASMSDPSFAGSPLHRFVSAAFDGTFEPGITRNLVNGDT